MNLLKYLSFILPILLIVGCSDSGDSPTAPSGGGGTPALSVNDVSGTEGSTITFTVALNVVASSDVIFEYTTASGTATAGDFTASSGSDTITAGNLSVSIQVPTIEDTDVDKNETFTLTISNVLNADVSKASGTATIIDNDISFSLDVRPIIQGNSCLNSGCHGTGSSSGGFSFGTATYTNITTASGNNGAIVVAGNAATSNMYLKVTSSPPFGGRMPAGGNPALSTTDINKIRDWINQGALDN